ncbi:MAG: hypothetical protein AB7W59_27180 [Acidimicrobiia bacterium]
MSLRPHRDRIDAGRDHRTAAVEHLRSSAPDDPLQAVAFWRAVLDLADDAIVEAVERCRREELTWAVIGLAYDRAASTTFAKFAKLIGE